MKFEFGELESFGKRGRLAGVGWLIRALGSSGESDESSCSEVQHSLAGMTSKRMVDG